MGYFKGDGEFKHKSFVFVSDELSHNATSVFLILTKFLPELMSLVTPLNRTHYCNKTIFGVIPNHISEFGFPAVWNYFEAGHGWCWWCSEVSVAVSGPQIVRIAPQ